MYYPPTPSVFADSITAETFEIAAASMVRWTNPKSRAKRGDPLTSAQISSRLPLPIPLFLMLN